MDQVHKPTHNTHHTDIQNQAAIYRIMPLVAHPYMSLMRLDRPVGAYLLFLPCLWGVLVGFILSPVSISYLLYLVFLFGLGAIIMRGAGCVINDLWDKNIDQKVERTRARPLASGAVSIPQAFVFLGILLAFGLIILMQLPRPAIIIGFISMIPVILYPLAKRITWYPQFILGVTFNAGVLIGGASLVASFSNFAPLIWLYLAAILWTIGYDTVYAHQDREDDQKIGVKSTALKFGKRSFDIIVGVYTLMFICVAACLILLNAGAGSWLMYIAACFYILSHHYAWNPHDPADCLFRFKSHIVAGWLIAFTIAINLMS